VHLIGAIGHGHGSEVDRRWVGAASGSLVNGQWLSTEYGRWHGRWVGWSVQLCDSRHLILSCS